MYTTWLRAPSPVFGANGYDGGLGDVGLCEAVGVVGVQAGVEAEEGAQSGGLVVVEVGAREVAVEVGGEDPGVGVRAESGQGEAVGAAGVADLAGQEQVAYVFPEAFAAVDPDQPGGGEARAPFVPEEGFQFLVGDRGGVIEQVSGEAGGVPPPGAQEPPAVQYEIAREPPVRPRHIALDHVAVADCFGVLERHRSPLRVQIAAVEPGRGSEACSGDQVRDSWTRCSQGAVQSSPQSRPGADTP